MVTTAQARAAEPQPARRWSLSAQFATVTAATFFVAGCTFLATRLYSMRFGVDAVSAVLVFRLGSSLLVAAGSLGMSLALQRTVAFHHRDPRRSADVAVVGLSIGALTLGAACGLAMLFAPAIAREMHHADAAQLWVVFAELTWAQGIVTLLACIELARGSALMSSLTNAGGYGISLILPLLLFRAFQLEQLIAASVAVAMLACLPAFFRLGRWWLATRRLPSTESDISPAKEVLRYGFPRAFGNLMDPATDLILPSVALSLGGLEQAGFFAASLGLLRPLNPLMSALNMILIPDSARLVADQNHDAARSRAELIAQVAIHFGLFAAAVLAIWGDFALTLWLGPSFAGGALHVRVLAFSILPVLLYGVSRGIIDGHSHRAINTANLAVAFAVFVGGVALCLYSAWTILALAAVYLVSRFVLGGLSLRHLFKIHGVSWRSLQSAGAAGSVLLAAALMLAMRWEWHANWFICVSSIVLSGSLFLFLMYRAGAPWTQVLARKVSR